MKECLQPSICCRSGWGSCQERSQRRVLAVFVARPASCRGLIDTRLHGRATVLQMCHKMRQLSINLMEIMSKGGGYIAASVEGRLSVASEQKKEPGHVPDTKKKNRKKQKAQPTANWQHSTLELRDE